MTIVVPDTILLKVKELIGQTSITDGRLKEILEETKDSSGTWNAFRAAAWVWRQKAADAAELVDVSEAGSSRGMSAIYRRAMELVDKYEELAVKSETETAARPRTRAIERV